ncbi:hypothetical protein AB0K51_12805 [Kitasatospora sp. NPDC049285]|uniref:hypothetical protein n=1 Tax=Kitasatospora sp. NPDC049285 TaxID=3157096 RepID=UPI003430974A
MAGGTFADTAMRKSAQLPTTAGRFLRLRALTEAGNRGPWTSASEIILAGTPL